MPRTLNKPNRIVPDSISVAAKSATHFRGPCSVCGREGWREIDHPLKPCLACRILKGAHGFTLVEVLVSVALLGIVGAGFAPLLSAMVTLPRLAAANGELANLRQAYTHVTTANVTVTNVEQLRPFTGFTTGNYTVDSLGIEGVTYPGLVWSDTLHKWSLH